MTIEALHEIANLEHAWRRMALEAAVDVFYAEAPVPINTEQWIDSGPGQRLLNPGSANQGPEWIPDGVPAPIGEVDPAHALFEGNHRMVGSGTAANWFHLVDPGGLGATMIGLWRFDADGVTAPSGGLFGTMFPDAYTLGGLGVSIDDGALKAAVSGDDSGPAITHEVALTSEDVPLGTWLAVVLHWDPSEGAAGTLTLSTYAEPGVLAGSDDDAPGSAPAPVDNIANSVFRVGTSGSLSAGGYRRAADHAIYSRALTSGQVEDVVEFLFAQLHEEAPVSDIRYVGFATETEYDQSPPPAADVHLDMNSTTLDVPDNPVINVPSAMHRGTRKTRPGFYSPTGDIQWAMDIRTLARALYYTLGCKAFTAGEGGDPNIHEFWVEGGRLLPSFASFVGKDKFEHVFSGCIAGSLTINVDGELLDGTMDIVSARDRKAMLKTESQLLLPDEYPLAFHEVTLREPELSPPDDDVSPLTPRLSLSINNGADVQRGRALGSRHPYRIPVGDQEITLTAARRFLDTLQIERFWGGEDGPADGGGVDFPLEIGMNAGDDGQVTVSIPAASLQSVKTPISGREEIDQELTIKPLWTPVELEDETTVSTPIYVRIESYFDADFEGGAGD